YMSRQILLEALGYGIQISPNVVRILEKLGLKKQLEKLSHICLGFQLRSFNTNKILAEWKLDNKTPYYQCRRADLHQLLFNMIQNKGRIYFSQCLESYEQKDNHLYLHLKNQGPITAQAMVAADGINSVIRKSVFPQHQVRYSGYSAYRVILPFHRKYHFLWGKATVWMGKNHHVVVYPNGNERSPESWLNLVLVVKERKSNDQSWSVPADKTALAQDFANHSNELNLILEGMIESPEPCFKWGLFIHEPLPYWSQSKVTLLGDAAHPMLPFQAQGAAMAIEDAYVLAQYLSNEKEMIEESFIKYEQARMKRTAAVQRLSRRNADIFHASGIKALTRNLILGLLSGIMPSLLNKRTAWIYDYKIEDS
ncbi:FAD-dependent monooxygenase, partial [Richelia intracellularis]|uniref:FAD-dependent monooxygenase n=1 Tax=Richelia intracellularis TaxID=1164990 RepID=UPI0018C8C565